MILIVEGMDNCGKSTLIKDLRKEYFTRPTTICHHSTSPPKDTQFPDLWEGRHYGDLFSLFTSIVTENHYDIVLDRFHLGAIVYGAKYRSSDPHMIKTIDKQYLQNNFESALLLLTDSNEGIMSRDDGMTIEQTSEEYDDVRRRFIDAFSESHCPNKLHIDITKDVKTIDKVLPNVLEWLNKIEE